MQGKEIIEEFKTVVSGRTFDALLPPILFVAANSAFGLNPAVLLSLGFALSLGITRMLRRQNWKYALGGFAAVSFASGLAYLTRTAAGYFLPAIAGSAGLALLSLASLAAGKPLAVWASHLTRGWPLKWFWRKDVKPAYSEVTVFWSIYLVSRLVVQVNLYRSGDAAGLAWANLLLGWPVIAVVLTGSYIYGVWRLRRLHGPGVEEFKAGAKPPWKGQTRGF